MPSSKQRKKKRRNRVKQTPNGIAFFEHPLSRIPREELVKGFVDIGRKNAERFPAILKDIQETINEVDALQLLGTLSTYGMMGGITETGARRPLLDGERFNQSHVELAQALALQMPANQRSRHPSLPDTIQKLIDSLPELAVAFHQQRLVQIEEGRPRRRKPY